MDFDLSEEQRLLKESVDGLLGSSYDFDARKKYGAEKGGWSRSLWNKLAEQPIDTFLEEPLLLRQIEIHFTVSPKST